MGLKPALGCFWTEVRSTTDAVPVLPGSHAGGPHSSLALDLCRTRQRGLNVSQARVLHAIDLIERQLSEPREA